MKLSLNYFSNLLSEGALKQCVNELNEYLSADKTADKSIIDDLVLVLSRINTNESLFNESKINSSEYKTEQNKITTTITALLKRVNFMKEPNAGFSARKHNLYINEIEFIRLILQDLPNLIGQISNKDASKILIHEVTKGLSFGRPVNFYVTGRTGAGKSETCNRFLNVNKTGSFDTSKGISHLGFGTGLSLFDLPGHAGDPRLENINRVALGLPLVEIPEDSSYDDELNDNPFDYFKYIPDLKEPKTEKIKIEDWAKFSSTHNLNSDLILFVIRLGVDSTFLQPDERYIGDIISHLKNKNLLNNIIFLINVDEEKKKVEISDIERVKLKIEKVYLAKLKDKTVPTFFTVNSRSGYGFEELIKFMCRRMPIEAIGQIKEIFSKDYQNEVEKNLIERLLYVSGIVAGRISKLLPFEKMEKDTTETNLLYACRAILYISAELLGDSAKEVEILKNLKHMDNILEEQCRLALIESIENQSIRIQTKGIKPAIVRTNSFRITDKSEFIDNHLYDKDILSYRRQEDSLTLYYDSVIGLETKTFNGLNDYYYEYILGYTTLYYQDEKFVKIRGARKAFEKGKKDRLYIETETVDCFHPVSDAIIGERKVDIKPKFKRNGINTFEILITLATLLPKVLSLKGASASSISTEFIQKRKLISDKIKSHKISLTNLIESNESSSFDRLTKEILKVLNIKNQ